MKAAQIISALSGFTSTVLAGTLGTRQSYLGTKVADLSVYRDGQNCVLAPGYEGFADYYYLTDTLANYCITIDTYRGLAVGYEVYSLDEKAYGLNMYADANCQGNSSSTKLAVGVGQACPAPFVIRSMMIVPYH